MNNLVVQALRPYTSFASSTANRIVRGSVNRVLGGPLVDAIARALVEQAVIERVVAVLAENGQLDRMVLEALESQTADDIASHVLESDAADRLAGRIIDSRLLDRTIERLLESDDLWLLVDQIVASPAVTTAISKQGLGMADQFAAQVRDRSGRADERVEQAVRRLVRRRAAAPNAPPEPTA